MRTRWCYCSLRTLVRVVSLPAPTRKYFFRRDSPPKRCKLRISASVQIWHFWHGRGLVGSFGFFGRSAKADKNQYPPAKKDERNYFPSHAKNAKFVPTRVPQLAPLRRDSHTRSQGRTKVNNFLTPCKITVGKAESTLAFFYFLI